MRKLKLLIAVAALMMGVGTASAREDVTTTFLKNGDLSALTGWTIDATQPGHETWPGYTDHKTDGAVNVLEFYSQWGPNAGTSIGNTRTFDFSQTATLPQGYYRLKVNGFYREGNNNPTTNQQKAYIYAGTKQQYLEGFAGFYNQSASSDLYRAAACFKAGYYENEFDFDMDAEGQIQIGFHGYIDTYCSWCIIGPVTLYKYEMSDFAADFNAKKAQAEALYSSPMNATVLATLQEKANVDQTAWTTKDQITAAESELNAAISAANVSIAYYAEAKSILDAATIYDAAGQASYAADATIAAIQTAYDARTLEKVSDEQKTAAKAALVTACKAQTQPADGCDMTVYIVNPDFNSGNTDGWTKVTPYGGNCTIQGGTRMEYWAGNSSNRAQASFNIYQELTNLPVGVYTITADMYNSLNDEGGSYTSFSPTCGVYGSAANEEVALVTVEGTTLNPYTTGEVFVTNGNLTLGTKNTVTPMAARWFVFDNVKLTYVRQMTDEEAMTYAVTAYNAALAAAQALNGKIPYAAYYALSQVISANTVTDGTAAEYNAAAAAINAAVANAQPLVEPYATWLTLKEQSLTLATGHERITAAINKVVVYVETLTAKDDLDNVNTMTVDMIKNYRAWDVLKKNADALVKTSTTDETARAEVANVRDTQAANISGAATDTQEDIATLIYATIPTATATLKAKMTTYVKAAQPTNDEYFDITFLIENAHFYEGEGGNKVATGWTLAEGGWITEHRLATHNFEAWHARFDLSQTITDLPKGTYKVTLQGFARHDDANVTNKTNLYCGIVNQEIKDIKAEWSTTSFYSAAQPAMGDGNRDTKYQKDGVDVYQPNGMTGAYYWFQEVNPMTEQPFYTNEVQTLITEPGDLKIGFKCETTTDWVLWDNFHLYYYGSAIAVELDEAAGSSYTEDIDNANVTLKKTVYEGWNTITVPFAAAAADFAGEALYKFTGDENATLNFETATSIEPNVPYLLKATTATNGVGEFKFNGVTVKAADELTTAGTNYNFVGTYAALTVAEGDYILGENDFYRSAGGNKVKAYRAYIQKNGGESQARLAIVIDGMATAIDAIDGKAINNAAIYNLAGQKVEKAQKGIFIQNGKKMVIK